MAGRRVNGGRIAGRGWPLWLMLCLLLSPRLVAAQENPAGGGAWPQLVISSDLAFIDGRLPDGRFHLELGPAPSDPAALIQGRLALELRPESDRQPAVTLQAGFKLRPGATVPDSFRVELEPVQLWLPEDQALLSLLPGWPPLLTLEKGQLAASLELAYAAGRLTGSGTLALSGGDGIYGTAFFRGLEMQIPFTLGQPPGDAPLIEATITAEIAELNPGIAIRPLRVAALYRAPLAEPDRGRLQIITLEAALLGGLIRAEPTLLPLAEPAGQLTLLVEGVDLARVLETHPVEGLHGSGLVDGRLPLRWGPKGFGMAGGHLTARPPGGRLHYESEAAAALARRNPAIKLVLDALADLHYNALSAGLDYHEDGTLQLALRLEGSNPTFERGRPIHLEINLEENIPSLLASLQLSNRISDTIRQRIKERYQ